jgi:hypothetical protein
MFGNKFFILCFIVVTSLIFNACDGPQEQIAEANKKDEWVGDANPAETKLKERGEQATRALGYQKEIKEKLSAELPVIELFTRETLENDATAKLGKPDSEKEVKLEENQQKVLYYNDSGFALWFWKPLDNKGTYQYRATISLKEGKFDVPLHNVFDEDELRKVQTIFEEKK